jgi:glycosyltransferase involved in cell wall biosynthesis
MRVPVRGAWLGSVPQARRLSRRLRPDVVHSHQLVPSGYIAELGGLRPHVSTAWGSEVLLATALQRRLVRRVTRRAALITGGSQHLLDALARTGADRGKLRWVPTGVDLRWRQPALELSPGEAAARLGFPQDRPIVLSPRGRRALYRQDVFVRAMAKVRSEAPDAAGVIIGPVGGGGEDQVPKLESLIEDLGLNGSVILRPPIPHEQMACAYRASSVCVSVPESDGSPVSVFEALSLEVPTIISDLPWAADPAFRGARLGVVPVGDHVSLASVIVERLADPAPKDAVANREFVERRLDRDLLFASIGAEYERLATEGDG